MNIYVICLNQYDKYDLAASWINRLTCVKGENILNSDSFELASCYIVHQLFYYENQDEKHPTLAKAFNIYIFFNRHVACFCIKSMLDSSQPYIFLLLSTRPASFVNNHATSNIR